MAFSPINSSTPPKTGDNLRPLYSLTPPLSSGKRHIGFSLLQHSSKSKVDGCSNGGGITLVKTTPLLLKATSSTAINSSDDKHNRDGSTNKPASAIVLEPRDLTPASLDEQHSSPLSNKTIIEVMCDIPVTTSSPPNAYTVTTSVSKSPEFTDTEPHTKQSMHNHNAGSFSVMTSQAVPVILTTPGSDYSIVTLQGMPLSQQSSAAAASPPQRLLNKMSKNGRIGRPKKSDVEILQAQGESSTSQMKCLVCKRVFPRLKSLEAHMRIHTGKFAVKTYRLQLTDDYFGLRNLHVHPYDIYSS